jgi:ElaB/YqjD/DUF883 family membrane-anchored ribosome-binding protein
MEDKHKKHETPKKQETEKPGGDSAAEESILEQGSETLGQAKEAVSDVKDKTVRLVSETYEMARSYGSKNPGKTMLVALGVGVGLGYLLGASSRRSGATGRFARPVVNALSDVALEFFR